MLTTPKLNQVSGENFATRLDFRSKFIAATIVSLTAFVWEDPVLGGCLMAASLILAVFSGVSKGYLALILKMMVPFFILIWISHAFFNTNHLLHLTGKDSLTPLFVLPERIWFIGGASASVEGTLYSLNILFKSVTMVVVVSIAIFTTDPNRMVVSIVRARIPYKVTFIFSSTLRFFPVLFRDIHNIIETQRLRGVRFEKLGFFRRIQLYAKLAIPLNLGALFKAQQMEVVLQAKGFSAMPQRTYLFDARLRARDYLVISAATIFLLWALLAYARSGIGTF